MEPTTPSTSTSTTPPSITMGSPSGTSSSTATGSSSGLPPHNPSSTTHASGERYGSTGSQASERLQEASQRLKGSGAELRACCRSYVSEHPGVSLGAAMAAGFLLRHLIWSR